MKTPMQQMILDAVDRLPRGRREMLSKDFRKVLDWYNSICTGNSADREEEDKMLERYTNMIYGVLGIKSSFSPAKKMNLLLEMEGDFIYAIEKTA